MRRTIILLFTLVLTLLGATAISVSFARSVGAGVTGGTPTPIPTAIITGTPTSTAQVPTETETPPDASATEATETATSTSVASETDTPIPSATETPTITGTIPTATATCVPSAGAWSAGPDLPTVLSRGVGVFFPTDGNFYVMGGRSSDKAGSDQVNPLEFNTSTSTWSTKSAAYDDNQVNNQACGVLTQGGTPYIFCVGGSTAAASTTSSEVRRYDPITDTLIGLGATDAWPGNFSGAVVPGGFAVANNKLYIIGGYDINTAATNEIWEFDPIAAAGSRWTQKINAPSILMYAPATSIGGIIYVGGASDYQGGTVVDTDLSFSFNPVANTIGTIATIPRATGETRAVTVNNQMWVLGGGRIAPNPSTEVDIYDPATDTWSLGPSFATPRRNAAADIDHATNQIWIAGGYSASGVDLLSSLEIFTYCSPAPTRTEVATNTVTATNTSTATITGTPPTATASATACTISFEDVPADQTFYPYIRCLACQGIISGYPCGGPEEPCNTNNDPYFRPDSNVTRGQFAKIASNSAGFDDPADGLQYEDVPPDSSFYVYIWRLRSRSLISGYVCGGVGEPCDRDNLPYFRPGANVTRGQLSKIDANAAGFNEIPGAQQYQDVAVGSTFYDVIWKLSDRGIIMGYPCGGPGEPCGSGNLPYFRPYANSTRAQASKIVTGSFFPECALNP